MTGERSSPITHLWLARLLVTFVLFGDKGIVLLRNKETATFRVWKGRYEAMCEGNQVWNKSNDLSHKTS